MVLFTLIRKDLLEQWRTKKILILSIIFLFVTISSPILAKITPELLKSVSVPGMTLKLPTPTYFDALDQFVKGTSQIALLVLVFVVAGAVSDEKNRKTLEILLTKPISRTLFILSKFKAYFISITAIFAASSLIFYLYTVSTFASFNFLNFAIMAGNVLLYILMIAAVTILASTVVKNSIAAGGIGFVVIILFGTIFSLIEPIKKYSPNTIFSNYKDLVVHGWNNDLFWPLIVIISVIIISIVVSILVFKGQEIER
ncbi:MAG: ABC transporter permease subunit [Candidatus Saccharibacteria bacterium]|nr:ABC transporter permease subunit [Candidatus Saccharibacteria bacterium]